MNNLKSIYTVTKPEGGTRPSEQMAFSSAMLFVFTVITLVAKSYDFEVSEYQAMALAGGLVGMAGSLSGIVLRWRSAGGTIQAKEPDQIKLDDEGMGV